MTTPPTAPKWGLQYQAWRISRLAVLVDRMDRREALVQLASEELGQPWRKVEPLPSLN